MTTKLKLTKLSVLLHTIHTVLQFFAAKSSRYATGRCFISCCNRKLLKPLRYTQNMTWHNMTGQDCMPTASHEQKQPALQKRVWPDVTATVDCCHTNTQDFPWARVKTNGWAITLQRDSDVICHIRYDIVRLCVCVCVCAVQQDT